MDYKNLFIRTFITSIFLLIYFLLFLINNNLIFYFIIIIYLIILIESLFYFSNLKKILISYIIVSFFCFIIYYYYYYNIIEFNLLIFTIIIFDISSYLLGSSLGKKKIFKYISPNKTYFGLIGGIFLSNIFSIFYILYFNKKILLDNIFLINFIIIFAFSGDIIESYFKRKNELKNSSNFLPGHGGFFDRFDSFIFAIIFLLIYEYILAL